MDKWKIDSAGGNLIVDCVISTTLVYGLGLFNLIGVEFGSMGCFFLGYLMAASYVTPMGENDIWLGLGY